MARQVRKLSNQKKKRVYRGIVHVQAGHHNTIVTITNIRGEVLCWSSTGACGFKGKENLQVSQQKKAAETAEKLVILQCVKQKVLVTGPGQGRESAIREIFKAGIKVNVIREKRVFHIMAVAHRKNVVYNKMALIFFTFQLVLTNQ
jgi:small subunit ribosomal protein S11